ncbi:MAG: fimbrillin family protein [Actinomycetota bacterium]|nr:fimbrillin family protein [Actinomycetota bacterium]
MRNRRSGLRKMSVTATAVVLVLTACSGDEESSDTSTTTHTTAPPPTALSSSSAPPASSDTTSTTAAAGQDWEIGETVLVTSDDGVYQIGAEGDVTPLVAGPVAYAVDDTQGGLLFQVGRGRSWDDVDQWSTVVWWIPRGASRPQELLVPTPGTDHSLSLHDAYATDEGFAVLYTRHEGVTPELVDRLRRFDVPARQVTELYSQGAFEAGFGQVSTNGELIAGVLFGQVGSGCFIYDLDGQPTHLVPSWRSDLDLTSDDYVEGCRLSPDGNRLVFETEEYEENTLASTTLHVWDLDAGTEATRFVIPVGASVADVSATWVMATLAADDGLQAHVFDLNAPEQDPVALPIPGMARFVDIPVDIEVPVQVGAGPNYYRYGDDGLYRVVNGVETQLSGDSVFRAYDDLMGGVVYRHSYDESRDVLWLGANADGPKSLSVTGVWDAALVDGQPMLLVSAADPERELCPDHDFGDPVMLHDLATGDQTFLHCHEEGPDGGLSTYGTSLGADMLVSVEWVMSTDRRIVFQDLSGQEMTVETNPVADPCLPCHLSVEISDDGALLAYSMWPTGFWPLPDDDHESAYETWKPAAETIPVEVAVLDLDSGREMWQTTLDPGIRLTDFDGRHLVVGQSYAVDFGRTGSVIYDTWGVHEPVEVDGDAVLIRQTPELVLRHDGLGVVSFGDPVGG